MTVSTKLALFGHPAHRTSLLDVFGTVKRAWNTKSARRTMRPLQDLDGWSDQAEVAFYEDARCGRTG